MCSQCSHFEHTISPDNLHQVAIYSLNDKASFALFRFQYYLYMSNTLMTSKQNKTSTACELLAGSVQLEDQTAWKSLTTAILSQRHNVMVIRVFSDMKMPFTFFSVLLRSENMLHENAQSFLSCFG